MINAAAILKTVDQLLKGQVGATRVVSTTQIEAGHRPFVGQAMSKPRYEITLETLGRNDASPVGAIGSHRLDNLQITVECHHKLKSTIQIEKRRDVLATALLHADVIMQALGYHDNLDATSSGTATDIVSGMLLDLDRDVVAEDWEAGELVTAISGTAIVRITQP